MRVAPVAGAETSRRLPRVAYLCMEFGIHSRVPIYSGGLGVLAGDTLKAAADRGYDVVGIGLLYRHGYSQQRIIHSEPRYFPVQWDPAKEPLLEKMPFSIEVRIEDKPYKVNVWRMTGKGIGGTPFTLYLMDTNDPGNPEPRVTDYLYRGADPDQPGHPWWRLAQEMVLGIGGVRLIQELERRGDIAPRDIFHLNEGHAALAIAERLRQEGGMDALPRVSKEFAFTTHTPVPAGHDRFAIDLVRQVLGNERADLLMQLDPFAATNGHNVNMTHLALRAGRANAVSNRHQEVTEAMFQRERFGYAPVIQGVTNGVHHLTWVSDAMAGLFDRYLGFGWRADPFALRDLSKFRDNELFREDLRVAHREAKKRLNRYTNKTHKGPRLDDNTLTIGIARRAAGYKRLNLLLTDVERLKSIARMHGPIQILISGKNHPLDDHGKAVLADIIQKVKALRSDPDATKLVRIVFLKDYDMDKYRRMAGGCDLWINNPIPPYEASGTSGMGVGVNGGLNISTPDGWWLEGSHGDTTGWTIPYRDGETPEEAAAGLYGHIEEAARLFYTDYKGTFMDKMINAITFIGPQFSTYRMVGDYMDEVWRPLQNEQGPDGAVAVPDVAVDVVAAGAGVPMQV